MDVRKPLLEITDAGLLCTPGGFYIDPWLPVERAIVTHAHSDHARPGSSSYLTSDSGLDVLRLRVGSDASIQTIPYGRRLRIGDVSVSLHPAGHILGSAQVRVEYGGEVWVFSGDYKIGFDRTAAELEPLPCDTFITESTFGLPIYRWQSQDLLFDEINRWWARNVEQGWTSIIYAYALGKSQRILAALDSSIGPIGVHGAVQRFLPAYAAANISLPQVVPASLDNLSALKKRGIVIAPPSAAGSPWLRKFTPASEAFASGWMQIRGARRRRNMDRGFVLSDHADWNGLLSVIKATGAWSVGVTHGYTDVLVRYLTENGKHAWVLPTRFSTDEDSSEDDRPDADLEEREAGAQQ